jgi:hypothetical protein
VNNPTGKVLEAIWKKRAAKNGRRIHWEWMPRTRWYLIPTIELDAVFKEIGIHILCLSIYIKWKVI